MPTPERIHLICRETTRKGYKQHGNVFITSSWRIAESAANSVNVIALHDSKKSQSWVQGNVIDRHQDPVLKRWIFTVQISGEAHAWPAPPTRGSEKAYV